MIEQTDQELVHLARLGSKDAFGYLIERYQTMAGRIARRMVPAEEVAQDLVQEAMLQAYLSLSDLRKDDSFRSWLYGIVLNVSKSYLRQEKRRSPISEALEEDQPEGVWNSSSDAKDPQKISMERELHSLVLSAIEELPDSYRESARLHYYDSLTIHEISAITGASPAAIKVRLHRARNQLRKRLDKEFPEIRQEKPPKERREMMVKANIADIVKVDERYVVLLQEEGQKRILPMLIGPMEGMAIAMGLRAYPTQRPLTFDFMAHLLDALGAQLEEVRVEVLKGHIFYGVARVQIGDQNKDVDARPSDVLALAVRTNSPIYVAEEILQQEGKDVAAIEGEFGKFTPGEGVEGILREFEEKLKKFPPPLQPGEKNTGLTKE